MKALEWLRDVSNVKYICLVVVLYCSLSIPLLLKWPPPIADEVVFGDAARTLVQNGYLGTQLVSGMESHMYWQPPIYFFSVAQAIKISGYSLSSLRVFSVLVGAVVILMVFFIGLQVGGHATARLGSLLVACDPPFVNYIKLARMDGLCILFVLMALAVFLKPVFQSKSTNSLTAGFLAALAAFTHPFGVIAVLVFTFWILEDSSISIRERLKGISLLLFPVLVGVFLWGLWIIQDTHAFIEQMSYQFARKDRPLILTLVNTFKQYRNVPLALAMPLVSLAVVIPRAIRQRERVGLLAFLLGAIMVLVIANFEVPYHVYIAPLGAITAAMLLTEFWRASSGLKRGVAVLCVGAWLLNSLLVFGFLNITFHSKLTDDADYDQFCMSVSTHLPVGTKVCGWGTPCIYWGLHKQRPDIQFRDRAFLDSTRANEVVREVGFVVLSRCFTPEEDDVGLEMQRSVFSALCTKNQRHLRSVAIVGKKSKYAYSAEIYQVVYLTDR
jgi:4-amino-4-deoxy-L-arabinose transferase-like glycosyltransferase